MSKSGEMLESQPRGAHVVQNDVRHAFNFAMPGHRNNWYRNALPASSVHRDQALYRALLKKMRILRYQIGPVAVADYEIKVALVQQVIFNAGEHQRCITLADFGHHHANRETSLRAK